MNIDPRNVRNISSRTKDGDFVWDGPNQYEVMNRVGSALILRPIHYGDHHYYVRQISGGAKRFADYHGALNAVGLPATAAQFDAAIATTQALLRAKAAA